MNFSDWFVTDFSLCLSQFLSARVNFWMINKNWLAFLYLEKVWKFSLKFVVKKNRRRQSSAPFRRNIKTTTTFSQNVFLVSWSCGVCLRYVTLLTFFWLWKSKLEHRNEIERKSNLKWSMEEPMKVLTFSN